MGYTIKLPNGIEVRCDSFDDLKPMMGLAPANPSAPGSPVQPPSEIPRATPAAPGAPTMDASVDRELLKEFIANGAVSSGRLQSGLGKRSKGLPGAILAWARRVGIASADDQISDVAEQAKTNDGRGWKLTDSAMVAAKRVNGQEVLKF